MRLEQFDPQKCIDHFLIIHCAHIDQTIPSHPRGADGVLAYCYLDPLRGYRLFLFGVVRIAPLKLYDNYYVSLDIAFYRLRGEKAKFYHKNMGALPENINKIVYEIKHSRMNNLMRHLNKMDIDGWKVMRI